MKTLVGRYASYRPVGGAHRHSLLRVRRVSTPTLGSDFYLFNIYDLLLFLQTQKITEDL